MLRDAKHIPLIIAVVCGGLASLAQSVPSGTTSAPESMIRTSSSLVLVDVVVTKKDKPVRGLVRSDFHILDDGKERGIVSFDPRAPGDAPAPSHQPAMFQDAGAPHTYTNLSPYPPATAANVLLLDALNTPAANQMEVRRKMLDYLAAIEPGTSLAIFTLSSRLRLVAGFTTDAAQLVRAARSSATDPKSSSMLDPATDHDLDSTIGDMANMGIDKVDAQSNLLDPIASLQQFQAGMTAYQMDERVRITMNALQQLARYLSGVPGRKNLIWLSGSFPIVLDPDDALQSPFEATRTYSNQLQETSELLSGARVAIYPVSATGLATPQVFGSDYASSTNVVSAVSPNGVRNQANRSNASKDEAKLLRQNMQAEATLNQIAAETGGKAYMQTNGLREAVADAVETGSTYYTLAFAPASLDGNFHKLKIRLDSSTGKLAYRSGYFAVPPTRSSALNPEISVIEATTQHGAPAASQILFKARVLDADDPSLKDARLPQGPAGEIAAPPGQLSRRVIVDIKADAAEIALDQAPSGVRSGKIEFVLIAYDLDGRRVNYLDRGFQMGLRPEQYAGILASGIPIRLALDLPPHRVFLRIAVHDLTSGRVGSIEIPYAPPQ
jgi:VWFA-related protein